MSDQPERRGPNAAPHLRPVDTPAPSRDARAYENVTELDGGHGDGGHGTERGSLGGNAGFGTQAADGDRSRVRQGTPRDGGGASDRPGLPNWAKLLMIASLTLNLVFVGLVLGQRMQQPNRFPRDWLMLFVPDAKHEMAKQLMQTDREALTGLRQQERQAQAELMRLLRAEIYDAGAINAVFEELRRIAGSRREIRHDQMLKIGGQLTGDERRAGADRLDHMISTYRKMKSQK